MQKCGNSFCLKLVAQLQSTAQNTYGRAHKQAEVLGGQKKENQNPNQLSTSKWISHS